MNLETCATLIVNRRWTTILLSALTILGLSAGASRITTVDSDFRHHFSEDHPHLIALEQMEDTYTISDAVLIAVAPQGGTIFTPEVLGAMEDLTEELWRTPYATRVDSITNYSHSEGLEDEFIVEPLIDDAELLTDIDMERIRTIALGTGEIAGRLLSHDGRVAGLIVSFVLPEADRQEAKLDVVNHINDTVARSREEHPSIEYHLTGELFLNHTIGKALEDELGILGPAALGTMLLVALLVLRSLWGMVAITLMIFTIIPPAMGFAGWTGMTLYAESGAALFVLMAIAVAHSVHVIEAMLVGLHQGMDRNQAAIHSLRHNAWPVFLTSITTAIGFLSLNFSEMPPFRVMGNIVAFGALCAFVYSMTLLPAFLSLVPVRGRPASTGKSGLLDRFGRFVVSNHMTLLYSSAVGIIVLIAGIYRIDLNENPLELLDESYEFRQATDFVGEHFTGLEPFEYSLDSGRENGITDVEYLEKADAFANWYRSQPEVAHVFGIADIMKRLNKNLHGDDPDFYSIPADPDLAAQYLLLYEFSLPIGRDLNNLINHDRSATRLTVILKSLSSMERIDIDNRAREWLRENAPDMETGATGVSIVGAYSIQRNISSMLVGTIMAMTIVSLLLLAVFRSIRLGLISLIPNFIPAAMAMGLWGYLVGEVGVAASVVTALAFGIVVDDTIHFMTKYLRSRKNGLLPSESVQSAFSSVGKALITTTSVFALGFMVFGASGIESNQALGLLMGITVIAALLADFLFLPPLLMVLDETRESREEIRDRLRHSPEQTQDRLANPAPESG